LTFVFSPLDDASRVRRDLAFIYSLYFNHFRIFVKILEKRKIFGKVGDVSRN